MSAQQAVALEQPQEPELSPPGPPIAEFGPSLPRILGIGALFGTPLLLIPFLLLADSEGEASSFVAALMLLAVCCPLLWLFCLRPLRQRVQLFPTGFAIFNGVRAEAFAFDAVARVYHHTEQPFVNGVALPTRHSFTVVAEDGRRAHLNTFLSDVATLGEAIKQSVFDRLLQQALDELGAGGAVGFDVLVFRPDGLDQGNGALRWEDISDVTLRAGYLYVWDRRSPGAWGCWALTKVPNLEVLLALIDRHRSR